MICIDLKRSENSFLNVMNCSFIVPSELNLKKAPGNKLSTGTPLPGKNGNPTFAAVAAGYDKSPGQLVTMCFLEASSDGVALAVRPPWEDSGKHDVSGDSGLWSPVDTAGSPNYQSDNSFSAFGPNSSFNLTRGWNESFKQRPSALLAQQFQPTGRSDRSKLQHSPTNVSLEALSVTPFFFFFFFCAQSFLGNACNPWSATTPFSSSIWSTSADSTLHPFSPSTSSAALTNLVSSPTPSSPTASTEMSRTFNPWSAWRPTLSRRSSEPWPSSPDNAN
uniref:Uncharacterized protein n=1 Tax=Cyprinodon variegatus TaxID=28743 RepID=A0A3Q2C8P0_CYPVA